MEAIKKNQSFFSQINSPQDLRLFDADELPKIAEELRQATIDSVSKTGGHLGAGLGVVELTVALHYVFNTPEDLLVWDIGHQAYPHKILTGRKDLMHTLRQGGGISGFLKRTESEYDTFGAGHSSTSISAALGMAVARDLNDDDKNVVAVIGDGSLSAGMAYEAMNNAGHLRSKLIVILNDNEMSIAPNVGAMNTYLNKLMSSKPFLNFRQIAKNFLHKMPDPIEQFAKKTKQYAKDIVTGGNFFEEMGFHYVGPLDGHDVQSLVFVLENLKNDDGIESPILVHIKTQKGKGFNPPFSCGESYHAVGKFDPLTKEQQQSIPSKPTYTKIFGETLAKMAEQDDKIVAITAAMPSGTGINIFEQHFPERTFDVGIAEQHAVTFAAGLATQGIKPYVAIYSTFMQRAYDQVVHDVAIQNLPVRFMMDRAGLVGADGPTHAGSFDLAFMGCLPNMVIMAPSDEVEFVRMLATSMNINDRPSAIRYPRGEGVGLPLPEELKPIAIGKGKVVKKGAKVAVLNLGTRMQEVLKASNILKSDNINITIADARFAKPLDHNLIRELAKNHEVLITIEEGSVGGFGSWVAKFLEDEGLLDSGHLKFRSMCLPDEFTDHDTPNNMYELARLNSSSIVQKVKSLLGT
ncbi:MAG: 1-deoxy-D-xylulose-5-phosphate synthase [Candidatus Midichloriaceae bacterium]|jgi:1-deoxy-D-xylulose-5-phosphate synthase|nr:1-deoxy-D-xylulose-5-phosphate synthase [Candidatus Midichloriaceae bacterium]